jgi:hypothetical protein
VIGDDDIVFADFGPIFEEFEADFGRTFVLGDDPIKHRLREALPTIFAAGQCGMIEYGTTVASPSDPAKAPRPEPSTTATSGTSPTRSWTARAASATAS